MKEKKIVKQNKKILKKMNWLKTCAEILELKKLDFKEQQYAIKTLKCVYTILLTDKARENYINELKRKVGKDYEE